jgi:hypothetical protein
MKAAILLVTLPLPVTSLAALNVILSDHKLQRSLKPIKPNAIPTTLSWNVCMGQERGRKANQSLYYSAAVRNRSLKQLPAAAQRKSTLSANVVTFRFFKI